MKFYMVLNDGETFTNLKGCMIVAINDEWDSDNIKTALEDGEAQIIAHWREDRP